MRKFIIFILILVTGLFLANVIFFKKKEQVDLVQKKEEIVQKIVTEEFSKIVSSWEIPSDSKLFVKETNIANMNRSFLILKDLCGSCKIQKDVKCLSNERVPEKKDEKMTEFGSSIVCNYSVSCEKVETSGSLVFKATAKDLYQISFFRINID